MVEIKARGAAKAEFTNVNEHFAATNNAEFGIFHQNLLSAWRGECRLRYDLCFTSSISRAILANLQDTGI
jgi:hypothetical protein